MREKVVTPASAFQNRPTIDYAAAELLLNPSPRRPHMVLSPCVFCVLGPQRVRVVRACVRVAPSKNIYRGHGATTCECGISWNKTDFSQQNQKCRPIYSQAFSLSFRCGQRKVCDHIIKNKRRSPTSVWVPNSDLRQHCECRGNANISVELSRF